MLTPAQGTRWIITRWWWPSTPLGMLWDALCSVTLCRVNRHRWHDEGRNRPPQCDRCGETRR